MKKIHLLLSLAAAASLAAAIVGCSSRANKAQELKRANRLFAANQFEPAETEYLNVLRADPQNAEAFARLGVIYFDEGRFQKAAPYLFKASQLDATNVECRLKLGQIYLAIGDLKNAHDEAEFVLEKNPQDNEAPVLFAESAGTQIAAARSRLSELAHNGDNAAVETALGALASRERDFKTALEHFQRAMTFDSHFAAAYAAIGETFWLENEPKKAEAAFKAAANYAPPYSPLQLSYGRFEIQSGNFAVAENFFDGLAKKTPDYISGWLGLAEVDMDEKKFTDCATALNKALAFDPDNVDAQMLNARLELARSQTAQATAELEQLVKSYPQAPRIHYQLALAYVMGGQINKALNQLHEATDLDPNFPDAAFLLAQLDLKTGDVNSAVDLFKRIIAQQPGLAQASIFLADAYRLQGDFNQAQEIYQQLEKTYPKNPEIPLLSGSAFIQQLNEDAARREFNRALQIEPTNVDAQEELAQLDLADRQFAAAQSRVENVVSKNPALAQPQILLAKIFLAQGQTNQAENALAKAASLSGGSLANMLLARLYFNAGQDREAMDRLNLMLEKNPNDPSALMLAGIVQTDEKNYQGAAASYQELLVINPRYSPALNNLAWLYGDYLGDLDKAYDLAQRASQLLPADPSTADTLGWVLFKKGQYLPALKLFQTSATGLPNNPEVQFHLGMANYMLANEDAAREAFQAALGLKAPFPERHECENCLAILNLDPGAASAAARENLEKRISEQPDDPVAFERLAAIYQKNNDTAKAAALCQDALKANPGNVKAEILLARLCASSDPKKAYQLAQAAYQSRPDDPEVCATLGELAFQNGNDTWAYTLLDDASQNQPNNAQTFLDLANAAFCVGKISEAQTDMQNAVQAGLPVAQARQAKNFLDMVPLCQDAAQALASQSRVDELLSSAPHYPPALFADALIQAGNKNPVGAERDYENLLARHPDCSPAEKNLAILYAQNFVDPARAYPVALKAREAFPDDPQVAEALALVLFQQGDYLRAADLFNTISGSTTADAQLFYCLGISEFHLKNFNESKTSLQRALNLNLSGSEASDARQTLAELKN